MRILSQSAKGSLENPGKHVKPKSGLNKSILDQGWSMFRSMLEYKLGWQGKALVKVSPHYTSQQCIACGHREKGNRPTQNLFRCLQCGHTENVDRHAARYIRTAGHAVIACGACA